MIASAITPHPINAVIDEIAADGVMYARRKRDLEFRADAVSGRDEHRLRETGKRAVKHAAEATDLRKRALIESPARKILDPVGSACGGVDINARVTV